MQAPLPDTMNFLRQAERNYAWTGHLQLARFQRLAELLLDTRGEVHVSLAFGNSLGYAGLKGRIGGQLTVQCQRCLQPMQLQVNGGFRFAFVDDEEESELLPEVFEPYVLEGEEQSMLDLLEDELLLSLPMVAMHDTPCSPYMSEQNRRIQAEIAAEKEAAHPFAALKALKKDLE